MINKGKRQVISNKMDETRMDNEISKKSPPSSCNCGQEAACQQLPNKTYSCVCPHDGSTPDANKTCRRVTVAYPNRTKINVLPKTNISQIMHTEVATIQNITEWNVETSGHNKASIVRDLTSKPVTYVAVCSAFLLVVIIISLYATYTKVRSKRAAARALMLKKNLFRNERFISNPQYSIIHTERETASIQFSSELVPAIDRNSIDELKEIGEGFFGKVYKGLLHTINNNGTENGKTVAIKTLKGMAAPEIEQDFMREVEITSSFHHPNILTLLGICLRENDNPPWMIFEYMPYGDLTNVLRNGNNETHKLVPALPTLNQSSLLHISVQIAEGMEYLASQHFVHRDLACRNCLVGTNLVVKIADFGMSRDVYTCDYYKIGGTRMLPVRWMSPESILFGKFTLESDVWSYGIVLWEVYNYGKQPYFGHTNEQVLQLVLDHVTLEMPKNCPSDVLDIINGCWQIDTKKRPTFTDMCNTLSKLLSELKDSSTVTLPRPPKQPIVVNLPNMNTQQRQTDDNDNDDYDDDDDDNSTDEIESNVDCLTTDDLLDSENYLKPNIPSNPSSNNNINNNSKQNISSK